ncbi:LysR family transcriptional regulator [Mesobaculum littorinae]|uniref:LysR family transcriptional regulator n=1 Tax=Mesobaculum littorinae TaxID=2486419 RepID=A0A438AFB6_9RHOB|nr:LysR family transcriptional regulator [Mesobaculum littorinae]RVV97396.1 LysR family transcriptional regulator [Mesobaculum littorinae]
MNWDDARYFLAIARAGQMLGAARRLGVSQATLSRRLATLEAALGDRLVERTPRGSPLTEAGQAFLATAERMESAALAGVAQLGHPGEAVAGTLRLGAPDGLGGAFLAPRLGRLRAAHPGLRVQLVPLPRNFSLSQREADVAVTVGRPERGRLRTRKLTDYSLGLYAAPGYLAARGHPDRAATLADHDLVGYVDDLVHTPGLRYAEEFWQGWRSCVEVSTAIGQLEAVRAGAGIGALHDFMARGQDGLVPVLPELRAVRSYWAVWHEDLRGSRRVRACLDFLDAAVSEDRAAFLRPVAGTGAG